MMDEWHLYRKNSKTIDKQQSIVSFSLFKINTSSFLVLTSHVPCAKLFTHSHHYSAAFLFPRVRYFSGPLQTLSTMIDMRRKDGGCWAEAYLHTQLHLSPSSRLATIWAENWGLWPFRGGGAGSSPITMLHGLRTTSTPSGNRHEPKKLGGGLCPF